MGVARAASAVRSGAILLDLRGADAFCAAHPSGALSLAHGPKVGYWAGWILPDGARIVLLASNQREAAEAGRQLLRVGIDAVEGYIEGGLDAWRDAGLPTSYVAQMTPRELRARVARGDGLTVMDVRSLREWRAGHIDGATHVPVGDLGTRAADVPRDTAVATICEGGYRSTLAASLLSRAGVGAVFNVTGGMAAYRALQITPD